MRAFAVPRLLTRRVARARARTFCSTAAPKRLLFLGTPPVAARTLETLNASADVVVIGAVTQPPSQTGRKRAVTPSAVHAAAMRMGIPVLCPVSAREGAFLDEVRALEPDVCVTAAYGNYLPRAFLEVPRFGTLNIHPSLLPAFRGAAPVPRALEAGVDVTGVSVAFTVGEMDAGNIVGVERVVLGGNEQAPELLEGLFDKGTQCLIRVLPRVFDGSVVEVPQDKERVSQAPKIGKEEGRLAFTDNAKRVHNRVRAFAGWPGTWGEFVVGESGDVVKLKVLRTEVIRAEGGMCFGVHEVKFDEEGAYLAITCDDGSVIAVHTVQPPGKKPMDARAFWNGLRGKRLERRRVPH